MSAWKSTAVFMGYADPAYKVADYARPGWLSNATPT